jgi:hypothetical protein
MGAALELMEGAEVSDRRSLNARDDARFAVPADERRRRPARASVAIQKFAT